MDTDEHRLKLGACGIVLLLVSVAPTALSQERDKSGRMSAAEAKKLKSPVPYTKKSISQGRTIFVRTCAACHGADGKAEVDVVADATDLTSPKLYKSGTSEGEIFRSIRDGAGETMPPFKTQITQETDIWRLVNFIRSLWPESQRPPLQDKPAEDSSSSKKERGST